ncbi:metallopeptidase family protein [Candidatus Poriferisocius sp.]|uniref:metallopeptidase family protein n=1 Tax=Candidatus Poriferisocius sp. TaxID=3101276 RepID=UPI003B5AD247
MVVVSPERFEALVAEALDGIPDDLAELMENVAVLVEDEGEDPDIWGLYEGVPLTDRVDYGGGEMVLPDRIFIYRLPICAGCHSEAEVVEQVGITVIHEVAHHFGIDDDRLDELGWA